MLVKGDRDALAQVLVNLLSNAEKYSGDKKEIRVELSEAGLRVCDRGLGVPKGCEEKIFEQFFRAHDSLASGIEGSGLGLTLAQQIVRAHGGSIGYEPHEGGGSCFIVRIPHENENPGG
jgi:signal transduction histidine kinase